MASPGRIAAGKKGNAALEAKYGPNWASVIGRLGGRPTFWEALEKAKERKPARRRGHGNPALKGGRR